jgi:hypothetical protein
MTISRELAELQTAIDENVDKAMPAVKVIAVSFVVGALLLLALVILAAVIAARVGKR